MPKFNKKPITAVTLISIFLLVLFLTTYFNITSGNTTDGIPTELDDFYLAGPDPYYNMRICDTALETGKYPYYNEPDPLLNYPLGTSGARPPLFNMMAVVPAFAISSLTGIDTDISLGYMMQFIPALFGALLIFPVYFIGKTIFNRKVGIISALLVPLIPVHLASGHGSAYALFDHDSFVLFLMATTFFLFIKSLKEKDRVKGIIYACLTAIPIVSIELSWVSGQVIFVLLSAFLAISFVIEIFRKEINIQIFERGVIMFGLALFLLIPIILPREVITSTFAFFSLAISIALLVLSYIIQKLKVPWIITAPVISIVAISSISLLYMKAHSIIDINLGSAFSTLANTIFGRGIYGNKVSGTIAESATFNISRNVMSFGPALLWIALISFVLFTYLLVKDKIPLYKLFISYIFVVQIWFLSEAGRFINDLVPMVCIFGAFGTYTVLKHTDIEGFIRTMQENLRGIEWYHCTTAIGIALGIYAPFLECSLTVWTIYYIFMIACLMTAINIIDREKEIFNVKR